VFENEHVRVLEVRSPPGQQIPMHSHPPRVVVPVGSYRLKSPISLDASSQGFLGAQ
jgi:hypothetical protein